MDSPFDIGNCLFSVLHQTDAARKAWNFCHIGHHLQDEINALNIVSGACIRVMRTLRYKIQIRKEDDGTYTVIVPSLPGCLTYGDTIEEAIEMSKEAIELYIESLAARGLEIPVDEDRIEATVTVEANA
jgi:predicted RNase H-like HicB family nuclease